MSNISVSRKKSVVVAAKRENELINYIFIFAISVLLIIAPFYRGLYFRENYIPFAIIISGIFIVFMVYRLTLGNQGKFTMNYLEAAVLLLPIAYLISSLNSVNMKSAFDSILKYASYFMIFFIVSRLSKGEKKVKLFSAAVVISLFIVAITGLMAMSGYMELKGVTLYNRLYGLYQYPNTTGSMLGAGVLISLGMMRQSNKLLINGLLQVLILTIFSSFVLTLSLGAFIVFSVVALAYLIIIDYRSKLNQICAYLITVLSSLPILISYFRGNLNSTFLIAYIISIILGVILQLLYTYVNKRYIENFPDRAFRIIVIASVLFVIAAAVMAFTVKGIIPESVVNKIWIEGLKSQNASDRLIFTQDGIKMFMDNFFLGSGGGAWQDLYFKYQSFPYTSTEAHNFYVQLAIETGIVGVLILVGMLFLLIRRFIKDLKSNRGDAHIPIYFGIYMILGHAVLDFDLSLAAPMFLLWCLIGIVSSVNSENEEKVLKSKYTSYGLVLMGIVIFYFSTITYLGIYNGNIAAKLIGSDVDRAVSLYSKAMTQDRFNGALRMDYAQIMYNKQLETQNGEYLKKMNDTLTEIEKYEPYNWRYKPTIISLLMSSGKFAESVKMADSIVAMKPLSEDAYNIKGQVNLHIANYYYKSRKYDESIEYLNHTIAIQEEIQAASVKSIKPFTMSDQVRELVEQAQTMKESAERSK